MLWEVRKMTNDYGAASKAKDARSTAASAEKEADSLKKIKQLEDELKILKDSNEDLQKELEEVKARKTPPPAA
jgi:predicted  nucleic acid-binding Zn-ribbon protein